MYADFYKLTDLPFRLTPDDHFFFGSSEHTKALAFLNYGIAQGEGFVIITGEIGAGKTTLVEHLLASLASQPFVVGLIVTAQLDSQDTVRMTAASFGLLHEGREKSTLIFDLRDCFDQLHAAGKRALLIVDEAQSLSADAVEELRMLSNLQGRGRAGAQVVLLGQPELRELLASRGFEQVRQRVAASYHLGPLDPEDARNYIEHRLRLVDWRDDPRFTPDAFAAVYQHTGGIPRRINSLLSRLFLLGYLDQLHEFDGEIVHAVARELEAELGLKSTPSVQAEAASREDENSFVPQLEHLALRRLESRVSLAERKLDRHEIVIKTAIEMADHQFRKQKPEHA